MAGHQPGARVRAAGDESSSFPIHYKQAPTRASVSPFGKKERKSCLTQGSKCCGWHSTQSTPAPRSPVCPGNGSRPSLLWEGAGGCKRRKGCERWPRRPILGQSFVQMSTHIRKLQAVGPDTVAQACNSNTLAGRGRRIAGAPEFEISLGNIVKLCLYQTNKQKKQPAVVAPVVPATGKVEVRGSLNPGVRGCSEL